MKCINPGRKCHHFRWSKLRCLLHRRLGGFTVADRMGKIYGRHLLETRILQFLFWIICLNMSLMDINGWLAQNLNGLWKIVSAKSFAPYFRLLSLIEFLKRCQVLPLFSMTNCTHFRGWCKESICWYNLFFLIVESRNLRNSQTFEFLKRIWDSSWSRSSLQTKRKEHYCLGHMLQRVLSHTSPSHGFPKQQVDKVLQRDRRSEIFEHVSQ